MQDDKRSMSINIEITRSEVKGQDLTSSKCEHFGSDALTKKVLACSF